MICAGCEHDVRYHDAAYNGWCIVTDCDCEEFCDEPPGAGREPDYGAVTASERWERDYNEKRRRRC